MLSDMIEAKVFIWNDKDHTPEARISPSLLNLRVKMVSVCPFSSPTMSPWPMSHSRTLLSVAPEAKNFPLGEKSSV